MKYWRLESEGYHMVLTLDLGPTEKQNKLCVAAIEELDVFLEESKPLSLVIASAKPGSFCAGADIKEISQLLENPNAVDALFERIDRIVNNLQSGGFPSVAAIDGVCLGGGLELPLMCTERIASNNPKTILGLPETSLGIIPGFGGTQMLPRIVGLAKAAEMILGGAFKKLSAADAKKCGLVTLITDSSALLTEAKRFAKHLSFIERPNSRRSAKGIEIIPWLGRKLILSSAAKRVIKATNGVYPAPLLAIEAMRWSSKKLSLGIAKEHRLFKESVQTKEAKSLISLYFIREEAKSKNWVQRDSISEPLISPVGILGAGVMGRGIALSAISAGLPVVLHDSFPDAVHDALLFIGKSVKKEQARGKLTAEQAAARLELLTVSTRNDYSKIRHAGFIIEAVKEDLAVKQRLLGEISGLLENPKAIIATNTSSLVLEDVAAPLLHKDQFCAMHFFNPAEKMELVEIAGTFRTSPETLATAVALTKKLGKIPIVLEKACAGLVVNRILLRGVSYAMDTFLGGSLNPWWLDSLLEKYGFMMGPFKTLDLVGFDTADHVMKFMATCYPDAYSARVRDLDLKKNPQVLGRKTGRGFYLWNKDGHASPNQKIAADLGLSIPQTPLKQGMYGRKEFVEFIAANVLTEMKREAEAVIDEGVLTSREMIDLSMILGAGICPNRRGILGLKQEKVEV